MSRLATLGPEGVWIEGEAHYRGISGGPSIAWLFAGMRRAGVGVLYVHRDALPGLGLPSELDPPMPGERRPRHPWLEGVCFEGEPVSHQALSPSIECRGMEVLIGAYQDGAGDPFDVAADARELLAAVCAFRDAFKGKGRPTGWAFRNSAIQTGWKLMHAPWQRGRRKASLPDLTANPRPQLEGVGKGAQVEVPYGSWATTGGASYPQRPWVLAWDVNGQRLAATARLSLGVGGLEQRRPPPGANLAAGDFDPRLPGYHYVRSIEHPHAGAIPPIFETGWHSTPRVAMAAYLGLRFELAESWVWTDHVAYLNPWYEAMRDARAQLLWHLADAEDAGAPGFTKRPSAIALGALKQTYLQPLGRLRSARAREQGNPLYRPDWYDAVIGQELAREYLRLHQLAELGVPVLAVYFDTIIIEADSPDLLAAPEPLQVNDQLGKFAPLGALPGPEARAILYANHARPDVGALVKALRAAGACGGVAGPAALSAFTRPTHGGYPSQEAPCNA